MRRRALREKRDAKHGLEKVKAVSKLIEPFTNEQSQDSILQLVGVVEINAVYQHFPPYPSQHAEQFH